jgi:nifR3 family TIM-barrel protein
MGRLILAPMDGFSDQPYREICRNFGSAISITEFINTTDVIQGPSYLSKRIAFIARERPVGFQIYGNSTEEIIKAYEKLEAHSPDFIDLNLGCSERHVAARGAGSGLLRDPLKIGKILSSLVKRSRFPITAKIRLGWDKDSQNYLEIARTIEGSGASMIAVHGRTRDQRWRDPVNWEPIAEVKKSVLIPVVGNGDVRNTDDIKRMFLQTDCDGIMIGRAAIGNPWIFSQLIKKDLPRKEILKIINMHWQSVEGFYGRERALVLFRKHLKAYLTSPQFFGMDLKKFISAPDPIKEMRLFFTM